MNATTATTGILNEQDMQAMWDRLFDMDAGTGMPDKISLDHWLATLEVSSPEQMFVTPEMYRKIRVYADQSKQYARRQKLNRRQRRSAQRRHRKEQARGRR